jgi:two-component system chemotaxis response regulator CheB
VISGPPLRVLVVDDSAVSRESARVLLSRDPAITVELQGDPVAALERLPLSRPDVIVLDLEMPRMHGLEFLRRSRRTHPAPVVVCSAVTRAGTVDALRALDEGASRVLCKHDLSLVAGHPGEALLRAVRGAVLARAGAGGRPAGGPRVVAIGASVGGTQAVHSILAALPADVPPIVVVQHMPAGFTGSFAASLDQVCRLRVREAAAGVALARGEALVAPGGRHLRVVRRGGGWVVELGDDAPVRHHRPSVDVLFRSVGQAFGAAAVGVLLTGMGDDGAAGLLEMHQAGAHTIAQDERTSAVFGMPKEAIARGAARRVLPLPLIAGAVMAAVRPRAGVPA